MPFRPLRAFHSMPRPLVLLLTACTAFVAGVSYEHFGRDAQAQSAGVSTVYVPPGGVVFRSLDGAPLARITRDAHGGVLEMYDDHREVTTRVGAGHPRGVALAEDNPYSGVE
ncbi:MAG TPA: hypothetical protein VIY73_16710 [Polyangiaceae bacterium]